MITATTPRDKALLLGTYIIVASVSAYMGTTLTRHRTEQAVEAMSVETDVTAATKFLVLSEMLEKHGAAATQQRITSMAKTEMNSYERGKANPLILPQTRAAALKINQKLAAREMTLDR
jgi:hypothetical protein